jgi:hypothetical protein
MCDCMYVRLKKVNHKNLLEPLNPLYYNSEREMIGHDLVPMDLPSDGVYWCRVCGGHPSDPVHQPENLGTAF